MILSDFENKLKEIDPNVFYGLVDRAMAETVWDYTVFNRTVIKPSANRTAASDRFDVHVVRENYIPEGMDTQVIDKVCELPGVRLAGDDITFDYVQKPNTNIVVEMMTISFVRARKAYV